MKTVPSDVILLELRSSRFQRSSSSSFTLPASFLLRASCAPLLAATHAVLRSCCGQIPSYALSFLAIVEFRGTQAKAKGGGIRPGRFQAVTTAGFVSRSARCTMSSRQPASVMVGEEERVDSVHCSLPTGKSPSNSMTYLRPFLSPALVSTSTLSKIAQLSVPPQNQQLADTC